MVKRSLCHLSFPCPLMIGWLVFGREHSIEETFPQRAILSSRLTRLPLPQVPFEEDEKDPKTWFLDLDYIEGMWEMFRKVNGACHRCSFELNDQELNRSLSPGKADRVLPHRSDATLLGPRDLRALQAIRAQARALRSSA